jgi:SPP1 gp7 family putative phage head morphogenesis protein
MKSSKQKKPRDSRDLKNKYSAIIRVEVKRHSAELQHVIENYIYRVWLAGAVEQCRDLGCTGWFFSSLSKSSTSSESASAPDGASLQEAPRVRNVKADKSGWVSLPNFRAQEYAKKHAAEAVTQINDTTRKEIARIVSDGVKSGSSYNDIANAIKDKFEEFAVPMPQKHVSNRAVLVAVTELANAYCEGNAQVGNYLQDNGVKMMKAWQTLEDDRVSDGCKENERVGWIPINKEFPSGHMHPPRFPGCRCDFLQDILEEDMLGKPIEALYGKQYTNSAVNITKSSPSKTVSSQVQQVTPSKKTKAGKAASKRVGVSSAPSWDKWDLKGVEEKINSLRPEDYHIAMDAFAKGDESEFASCAGGKLPDVVKLLRDKKASFSSMPEPLKDSIQTYTGSYYLQMNEYLRKGRKVNSLFSDEKSQDSRRKCRKCD